MSRTSFQHNKYGKRPKQAVKRRKLPLIVPEYSCNFIMFYYNRVDMKARKTVFRTCLIYTVLLCAALFRAVAETDVPAGPAENLLMMTLNDIADKFGFPVSVFTVRGPEESQDDIVFRDGNGTDLYIANDHVWQVALHTREAGSAAGVSVGMTKEEAEHLLPRAVNTFEDCSQ